MAVTLQVIADFNPAPLAGFLRHAASIDTVEVAPFSQVYQALQDTVKTPWARVVWTLPEKIIPSFARAFALEEINVAECLAEVDTFADALIASSNNGYMLVASWCVPPSYRGYGILDWRPGLGVQHLLAQMNLRLAERLAPHNHIYLLAAERWFYGQVQAEAAKMWYATKVPFAAGVFERAAADVRAAVAAITGQSRRLILLDLDNTLWGGVIGETGWEGIRLGGHDHVGEAFKEFQRELKALSHCGIQLALVSKNDASVALEAFDHHPEMLLRRDDLAGWRINWHDKAGNIAALAEELNLGVGSMVFIDDNPAERDRVAQAHPALFVPDWPTDPTQYVHALRALACFDGAAMSREDRTRKTMYVAERSRRDAQQEIGSPDAWLQRLATRLTISPITASNRARVTQLFNKTNQLNLATRRLSEAEILAWAGQENHELMAVSATDQFGDMGLIGVISIAVEGAKAQLVDFILSCRIMGRMVEETLLHLAATRAQARGATTLTITYVPTARNRPTREVLEKAGLTEIHEHQFVIDLAAGYPKPEYVQIAFDA